MTGARAVPIKRESLSVVIALGAGMGVPPLKRLIMIDLERELRLTPRGAVAGPMSMN
jgi:hypothetical protein